MSLSVGVREFRQDLADYIDQTEPVTVTRHGRTVGLFVPVRRDRQAEIAAFAEAAGKASELLAELGMTEDAVVEEFDALRGVK
ncbi:MAG: type II toxin-antitoxin system prevent-host-death family antitoxin [Micrococcales bacterium]|nr:type II toxin-antitoxin system prevent-host-death family antitoxin [Micrococcales bacterium]